MIFINFKTFEEGSGENAVGLVKVLEEVSKTANIKVIPCVAALDLKEAVNATTLEVWIQNIDAVAYGANTGSVLPEGAVEDGAKGTLLNHSEHKFTDFEELASANKKAQDIGLKTLIFASNLEELARVCELNPTYASYEPPELIGSTTNSVASSQPEIIAKAVEVSKSAGVPLIVGAGIHNGEDVRKSRELGAVGVAVATDIVKAQNPKEELLDLMEGFK